MLDFSKLCGVVLSLLSAGMTLAERSDIAVPHLGYLFDSECRCILRIDGTPGAAVANPVATQTPLRQAVFAPAGAHALGVTADGGMVTLLVFTGGAADERPLPDAPSAPDQIAWSPNGSSAALYYGAERAIRVVSGLPSNPVVHSSAQSFEDAVVSFAVSDDGALLIAALANGQATISAGDRTTPLVVPSEAHAVGLAPASALAALLTGDGLYVCRNLSDSPACRFLAEAPRSPAVTIGFSGDGRRVYLAEREAGTIIAADVESGAAETASCRCAISGFRRLASNSVFLIETTVAPGIRVLDDRRILFVPREAAR